MAIGAIQILDMQAHTAIAGEGMKELFEELCVHVADLVAWKINLPDQIWPLAKVEACAAERFIHWDIGMAKPCDAREIAERLQNGLSNNNARVLDTVVHINMQITVAADFEVDRRMFGEAFEHMIEKADAGLYVSCACSVQIHRDRYIGFFGLAADLGGAVLGHEGSYRVYKRLQLARFLHSFLNFSRQIDDWGNADSGT